MPITMSVLVTVIRKAVNKLCIEQTDGTISQLATPAIHPQYELSGDGIPDATIYLSFDIVETETDDSSDDDIDWMKQIEGGENDNDNNTSKYTTKYKYTKYRSRYKHTKYGGSISSGASDTDDGKALSTTSYASDGDSSDPSDGENDGATTDHEKRQIHFLNQRKLRMADYCMPTQSIPMHSRGSSFFSSNRSHFTSEYEEGDETDTDIASEAK